MLKKSLMALATAGFLAGGSLMAAAPAAAKSSASFSISIGSPNFALFYGQPAPRPHLVCTPTYKRVYYKYKGKTYYRLVKTGQSCHWVYPSPPHGRYPYAYPYQYRPY